MPRERARAWLKGMHIAAHTKSEGDQRMMGAWILRGHIYSHLHEMANATASLSEEQQKALDRLVITLETVHRDWNNELIMAIIPLAIYINTCK